MKKYQFLFFFAFLITPFIQWIYVCIHAFTNIPFFAEESLGINIFLGLSMLSSFVMLLYALKKIYQNMKLSHKVKAMEQHDQIKQLQDKELQTLKYEASEKQRLFLCHMKQLLTILEHKKTDNARIKIHEFCAESYKQHNQNWCSDFFLNTILQIKLGEAQTQGIQTECSVLIPSSDLSDNLNFLELSSLFFNLLDNGIESCLGCSRPNPFLKLTITCNRDILRIHMVNSKNSIIKFNGATTKNDPSGFHGFGLKIIEEIAEQHHGHCLWTDQGNTFDSLILLDYTSDKGA